MPSFSSAEINNERKDYHPIPIKYESTSLFNKAERKGYIKKEEHEIDEILKSKDNEIEMLRKELKRTQMK